MRHPFGKQFLTALNKVHAVVTPSTSLLGVPGLHAPKDFLRMAKECQHHCEQLIDQLAAVREDPLATVTTLDLMSQHVCLVADTAELARMVRVGDSWSHYAEKASEQVQHAIHSLNTRHELYDACVRVTEQERADPSVFTTDEQRRVIKQFRLELELNGIHLPDETRAQIVQLQDVAADLAFRFQSGESQCLEPLLHTRHAIATQLGFASFAEMTLQTRVLSSVDEVDQFLHSVQQENKVLVEQEITNLATDRQLAQRHLKEFGQYLTVESCLSGVAAVLESLFGLELRVEPEVLWHHDVRKVGVYRDGSLLGNIYMDLFDRPQKRIEAATFAVGFGNTKKSLWDVNSCALVANLSKPLLTPNQCETLFHEIGHCMQAIFSNTEFQHLAGTRGPLDFVECPSTLMERIMRDPRVNFTPNAPRDLAANVWKHHRAHHAMEVDSQLVYSALDLALHGPSSLSKPISDTFKQVKEEFSQVPVAFQLRDDAYETFGHLAGYAGGYYSYLHGDHLSKQVFDSVLAADPLSRTAGTRLEEEMFVWGGSRDTREMIKSLS